MRDKLKNEQYFVEFLDYQNSRIEKFEKLRKKVIDSRGINDKGVRSATVNLFNFSFQRLVAMYSIGKSVDEMRLAFKDTSKWFLEMYEISYSDAISMASLGSILECPELYSKIKSKVVDMGLVADSMKLVLNEEKIKVVCNDYEPYIYLSKHIESYGSVEGLKHYLKEWYDNSQKAYWFDSHKSSNDTYFGYWSFESAAVAKKLEVDASLLCDCEHFPSDLV